MSRHLGIALAVLTLAACSGPGEANPTPPNTSRPPTSLTTTTSTRPSEPASTETRAIDTTVARPKHVDENTPCLEVITAADVTAATQAAVLESHSGAFFCFHRVDLYRAIGSQGSVDVYSGRLIRPFRPR